MSNIINLVSESVFSEKMDIQNAFLAAIASNTGSPSVNSWADVQALVRAGLAAKVFSVGDMLVCQKNGSEIVWDIIGIDCDTPTDKGYTHSLTLQTHKVFISRKFNTTAENGWKNSELRSWLNDAQNGFASDLDADFTAVLGAVDKKTAVPDSDTMITDITSDIFFIPSGTEMFGSQTFGIAEGVKYPFYAANADRLKYRNDNTPVSFYWTRSLGSMYGSTVISTDRAYTVNGVTGAQSTAAVNITGGTAPACCVV